MTSSAIFAQSILLYCVCNVVKIKQINKVLGDHDKTFVELCWDFPCQNAGFVRAPDIVWLGNLLDTSA